MGSDDDKGRIRNDQEVFIFPPLLLLHPDLARILLSSRLKNLNATLNIKPFRGAKFPFETSIRGDELYVEQTGGVDRNRSLYISGSVAFALREYLHAVSKNQVENVGALRDLAMELASFYEGIIQRDGSILGKYQNKHL